MNILRDVVLDLQVTNVVGNVATISASFTDVTTGEKCAADPARSDVRMAPGDSLRVSNIKVFLDIPEE